ncbi:MAG: hypothetical protein ABIP64_04545 [Burkholderiales bacterium]
MTAPFLDHLDSQALHHIIALRQTQPVQRALVNAQGWWVLHDEDGKPVTRHRVDAL